MTQPPPKLTPKAHAAAKRVLDGAARRLLDEQLARKTGKTGKRKG